MKLFNDQKCLCQKIRENLEFRENMWWTEQFINFGSENIGLQNILLNKYVLGFYQI